MAAIRPQHLAPVAPTPEPDYLDDRALIDAVVSGDTRAAAHFYDHLRPVIVHVLRRILRSRGEGFEDLVQATFERIIRGLVADRFEGRCNLTTWAGAIASHVALDAVRYRIREQQRGMDPFDEGRSLPAVSPEQRMEARSELDRLHHILSRMKPLLAEIVVLHDVLGHGLPEVAELTNASLSATQSRLFRARKELLRRARASVGAKGAT